MKHLTVRKYRVPSSALTLEMRQGGGDDKRSPSLCPHCIFCRTPTCAYDEEAAGKEGTPTGCGCGV